MITPEEVEELVRKVQEGERDWSKLLRPDQYSVELMFRLYATLVIPMQASAGQHLEMRKAFMAGYMEGFKALTEFCAELPEFKALQFVTRTSNELNTIMNQMRSRHIRTEKPS